MYRYVVNGLEGPYTAISALQTRLEAVMTWSAFMELDMVRCLWSSHVALDLCASTFRDWISEGKRAHKLKKNPRDTGRTPGATNRDLPAVVPGICCYLLQTRRQKRAFLPGHRPGVPGTPGHPGGLQKFYVIFSLCAFSPPYSQKRYITPCPQYS